MKQLPRLFSLFLCFALLLTVPALAQDSGNPALSRSQEQLAARWSAVSRGGSEIYITRPSTTAPYAIGALSGTYLDTGLSYLNLIRYAARLPEVALNDYLCVQAQYGATLLAAADTLSHTPAKPQDMDDAFYRMAVGVTARSNLSMRYGYPEITLLQSALQGCMDETSTDNRKTLGHRRWLLNPEMTGVGFGLATSAGDKSYIDIPIWEVGGKAEACDFVAWPASGDFPSNLFFSEVPWSVSLNPARWKDPNLPELQVVVTRLRDDRTWTLTDADVTPTPAAEQPYLLLNDEAYGSGCCITFGLGKDAAAESGFSGAYQVRIQGLRRLDDTEEALCYTVRFFNANALSLPADWAKAEIDAAAELRLIPEDLADRYDTEITRVEFCRLMMLLLQRKTQLDNPALVQTYAPDAPLPAFSDCTDESVLAAARLGIVAGRSDSVFDPGGLISRQEAAAMLQRTATLLGSGAYTGTPLVFTDAGDILPYAEAAVNWVSAVHDGVSLKPVMNGVGQNQFAPNGRYTRQQAILTALRLFRLEPTTAS